MIVVSPGDTPNNEPVEPTLAFALLLVHVPPFGRSFSIKVEPGHTCVPPAIAPGAALTVTCLVA